MRKDTMNRTPFTRLRQERERRGWSRSYVAEQVEVDIATVGRWERGERLPQPYYRQKLCELFERSAQELGLLSEVAEKMNESETLAVPEPSDATSGSLTDSQKSSYQRTSIHEENKHIPEHL